LDTPRKNQGLEPLRGLACKRRAIGTAALASNLTLPVARLYRAMMSDPDGRPRVVPTARGLSVRLETDIPVDETTGQVQPGTGGMSVAEESPRSLPVHRRRLTSESSQASRFRSGAFVCSWIEVMSSLKLGHKLSELEGWSDGASERRRVEDADLSFRLTS
jgi:hypothetical protein